MRAQRATQYAVTTHPYTYTLYIIGLRPERSGAILFSFSHNANQRHLPSCTPCRTPGSRDTRTPLSAFTHGKGSHGTRRIRGHTVTPGLYRGGDSTPYRGKSATSELHQEHGTPKAPHPFRTLAATRTLGKGEAPCARGIKKKKGSSRVDYSPERIIQNSNVDGNIRFCLTQR